MREWWRDAVIYQIYPRSYQDTTGGGRDDRAGARLGIEGDYRPSVVSYVGPASVVSGKSCQP